MKWTNAPRYARAAVHNADEAKQNYFAGGKGFCFASALFFKTAGILYPPRRRVREECAADSFGRRD
ncbi:MAG: hypothetical protein A3B74_00540 [Candidatus Kerfeldbacteria bacterium RIFCSPHIGHO2_02_FULL_42_14]|uniref:Uncharacterized protein n=1 Tax=Candidatus Kerfeldbacteria bacterium RIFCSPHIGHO2_02_FULL_42_14 TaxID=1798540 RepID=A0A1G2AR10_9BACT|nr:MAG: hypothetical protein A3B74_00540 [Candidatus Kerfeldbacteria bacterium RIFCSPHIGHO2_02_FULL_42_14]OGY83515.1 MAG: hypothetical protein A3I91_02635 [Candidatus Kerfeldbacteria bacterium RIFCSPLOWO2_02_FULL_42_19]OGY85758.1 MAG: hypothetical protein A3G01_03855 [Candidatus Kerfeldbacteria bacterium RIFCSPLOWO2_12_FULL_43_9]